MSLARLKEQLALEHERLSTLTKDHQAAIDEMGDARQKLEETRTEEERVESRIRYLAQLRVPKKSIFGRLFGLEERPVEALEEIQSLRRKRDSLSSISRGLRSSVDRVDSYANRIEFARAGIEKLQSAIDRKARKRDAEINLRAAAALNTAETRRLGAAVRRELERQPWCPYCGNDLGPSPHADHIYPVAKGGRSTLKNMVMACSGCNSLKGDKTVASFIQKYALSRDDIEKRLALLGKDF